MKPNEQKKKEQMYQKKTKITNVSEKKTKITNVQEKKELNEKTINVLKMVLARTLSIWIEMMNTVSVSDDNFDLTYSSY
jgi:hypothetical protein